MAGQIEQSQIGEARISSVQYVIFELTQAPRAAWQEAAVAGTLKFLVHQPHYTHEAVLLPESAKALAGDFS